MTHKRILAISDLHCGHVVGLTPPEWRERPATGPKRRRGKSKFAEYQETLWNFYTSKIDALKPIDYLFVMGDCTDGHGRFSGGTELTTADMNEQADMAVACLNYVEASKIVMVYGTAYHVGEAEDVEDIIAKDVKAVKIGSHEWVSVNGVTFDLKHHVGASGIPHGRQTPIAKERLWNVLWSEHGESPKSDVILRGHVHYHNYAGGRGWLAMSLPALQGKGSKFGARICSGTVDFGVTHFDVTDKGGLSWEAHLLGVRSKAEPMKLS